MHIMIHGTTYSVRKHDGFGVFITEIIIRAEEEKHIAAVQKAMEERGMLDHTILHGVFVGPARSGKNSLMERLLGRMPSSVSPSTGVAESVVQVKVIQKSATLAANVEELIWSVMDYDDEAIKLMLIHTGSQNEVEAPMLQAEGIVLDIFNSEASSSEDTRRNTNNVETITVVSESENKVYETQSSLPKDSVVIQSSSVVRPQLPNSYVPPTEIFKRALQKKGYEALKQHFEKTWSLNLTNTGGQMEFQEVLPLLVSGPSVFFFTFRLDRDLHEYYSIEYELSDGKKSYPYTSTLSTIDGMMQTLASISAMGTFVYSGLQRRDKALRPKVFFVGTHKDKLDSELADSHIARVDKELREVIGSTAYYKDLVEFASKSRLLFTVNNFSNSDSDFEHIRSAVQRVATRNDFQMTSPTHWLIFSLAIRKLNDRVISYDQCLEVARQCGLHADELDEALHFIHSKMGLIRYFPYEHINDLVFTDPQFLFDKVTELIVDTFTFEKTTKQAMDEFKKKGIFSLSEFEVISSRADSNMKPFQFAKLLERLRIAAPFEMDGNRMYFFPCVLAHTRMETPLYHLELLCSPVPNLIVTFKCGYCPKGLPGALVTYLLTNEMKSVYRWTLLHDEIFRNQVSFKVGPLDTVVFKIFSTYLEIIFNPKTFAGRDVRCPKERVCSNICQAVNAGIIRITSDINYVNAQHFFTFPCGCNSGHPGRLEVLDNEPFCLTCDKTNEQYPLPPGYELWQTNKAATDTTSTVAGVLSHSRDHSGEGMFVDVLHGVHAA